MAALHFAPEEDIVSDVSEARPDLIHIRQPDRAPKLDFEDPNILHDKMVSIEGRKFYVQHDYINIWSEKLGQALNGPYEVQFDGIPAEQFKELCNVISPCAAPIREDNCAALLDIAFNYGMPKLIRMCAHFIDRTEPFTANEYKMRNALDMFEVVFKYKMEHYMHQFGHEYFAPDLYNGIDHVKLLRKEWKRVELLSPEARCFVFKYHLIENFRDQPKIPMNSQLPDAPCIDFQKPNPHSDRVLVVGDVDVHVNAMYLACWSPYFRAMFFGKFAEAKQTRIVIQDVSLSEFQIFLSVIYPTTADILPENCAPLLDMANRFEVLGLMHNCAVYVVDDPDVVMGHDWSYIGILDVAIKHDMEDIKVFFALSWFASIEELEGSRDRVAKQTWPIQGFICQKLLGAYRNYSFTNFSDTFELHS